ncbi:SH3 domain-containing protein [Peribacillus sp. FSL H8-0477]|uniref:SH3 domain-containing protein n=1 Tax=Peribacillus sp. FSL H8-0477 TaxID=2921388 RepID=UPI0030F546FD
MRKLVIPAFCFAVLSTVALEDQLSITPVSAAQVTIEKTQYVTVSSGTLNMRKSGSTTAAVVAKLAKGTKVTVSSESKGWTKITANGKIGYVSSQYLSSKNPVKATAASITTKYVNTSSGTLNMRKSGSNTAAVVTKLAKGTKVSVSSESKGWAKITANGKTGYVSSQYLSTKNPVKAAAAAKTTIKYVNTSSGKLNMRKNKSNTAAVVVKLAKGTKVTVSSESKGWAKIIANGKTGYVSSQYLSTKNPITAVKPTTKYVNLSSGTLTMRKSASTSAAAVAKLAKGTKVSVSSESKGWAKITANGKTGYVSSNYLSTTKPVAAAPSVVKPVIKYVNVSIDSSLNLRKQPLDSAAVILKLARGIEATVISESGGWTKIKVYGGEGYVHSSFLSSEKPKTPISEPEETTIIKFVKVSGGSSLNMRSEASTTASVVTQLVNNTAVTVYSEENGWARVTANGKTGYVSSAFLADMAAETPSSPNKTIDKIVTPYNLSLNKMVDFQMAVDAQTDKNYKTYIREDALTVTSSTKGTVDGTGWRVRGGAGPENWVIATVKDHQELTILSKILGSDGYNWYEVNINKSWVNASPDDVKYNLNPDNFANDSVNMFQFVKLSQTTNLNASEVNERILAGKGILTNQAATFITAGETYGVNEIYLISHALLETGKGTSPLATGVEVNGKTVYNMYGIGAYDGTALSSGAQYAYNAGWFTPEAAIIGGAKFIANGYISAGQDTLYKMRWNPAGAANYGYATHQYATDIGWAAKQVKQIYNLYSLLESYHLTVEIPAYK